MRLMKMHESKKTELRQHSICKWFPFIHSFLTEVCVTFDLKLPLQIEINKSKSKYNLDFQISFCRKVSTSVLHFIQESSVVFIQCTYMSRQANEKENQTNSSKITAQLRKTCASVMFNDSTHYFRIFTYNSP